MVTIAWGRDYANILIFTKRDNEDDDDGDDKDNNMNSKENKNIRNARRRGMIHQKVCKQAMDHIKVKVNM